MTCISWSSGFALYLDNMMDEHQTFFFFAESLGPKFHGLVISNNFVLTYFSCYWQRGWLGVAKVSCILCHRGVQLILAYSWARPAILVAGEGRGGMFLFLMFLHFQSCSSFFSVPLFRLLYLFSLSLGDDTK